MSGYAKHQLKNYLSLEMRSNWFILIIGVNPAFYEVKTIIELYINTQGHIFSILTSFSFIRNIIEVPYGINLTQMICVVIDQGEDYFFH
ncbi:MAG: hypothetical protein ACXAC8_19730 [Candidatus Hodarchaeales archaeon]